VDAISAGHVRVAFSGACARSARASTRYGIGFGRRIGRRRWLRGDGAQLIHREQSSAVGDAQTIDISTGVARFVDREDAFEQARAHLLAARARARQLISARSHARITRSAARTRAWLRADVTVVIASGLRPRIESDGARGGARAGRPTAASAGPGRAATRGARGSAGRRADWVANRQALTGGRAARCRGSG